MKSSVLTLATLFLVSGLSHAEDIAAKYVDQMETEQTTNDIAVCKKIKKWSAHNACLIERQKKREEQGLVRGTAEYCTKNYGGMAFGQLREKGNELIKWKKQAPLSQLPYGVMKGNEVYITQDTLQFEINWIVQQMGRIKK